MTGLITTVGLAFGLAVWSVFMLMLGYSMAKNLLTEDSEL